MVIPVLTIHYTHFLKGFSCLRFNFKPVNIFSLYRKISPCVCEYADATDLGAQPPSPGSPAS